MVITHSSNHTFPQADTNHPQIEPTGQTTYYNSWTHINHYIINVYVCLNALILLYEHRFQYYIQYNTVSFIGKTKQVKVQSDPAVTGSITQYIDILKIRTLIKKL